ncbi:centromere protein P isoform X3 [Petaurus breviceps papuanus]|uniref:centromere protein P isoform X3 n=1 Tax=Petaurus breviceps papuanus TaxID=3040969 RepID=UPI0036DBC1A4
MDREREEQQQELRALRAEIGALRRRLQRMSPAAAPDPAPEAESEPERRFCQGDEPAPAGGGEAQLGRLELGLSFLSQGTGVRIKDYSLTRLELARGSGSGPQDGQRVLRKGHLAGQYHTVPFQLEFQLLETRSEESSSAVVTELSIILEHMEHGELSRFVARTEEKRDLFLFFRSLHFFLEWCEYRRQTFQYFQVPESWKSVPPAALPQSLPWKETQPRSSPDSGPWRNIPPWCSSQEALQQR